ncbi:MAG: helix-turn-helix domain-containing protein [bacterium]|nr:helix-turn-helix domain-containing protein [bacterium]
MRIKSEFKRKLRISMGNRLKQLRKSMELSRNKMAAMINVNPTTLLRNEDGSSFPEYSTLSKLAETFDVSMDWLLCNKGPMLYKKKIEDENYDPMANHDCMDALPNEYRELLENMDELPVLRYEILLHFRKYLQENKDRLLSNTTKEENIHTSPGK